MVQRAYLRGDVPVLGPIGVAVAGISTAPVAAIAADPVRHGILFFNPQPLTVLRIMPAGAPLASGSGGIALEGYSYFELYDSHGGNAGDDDAAVRINCGWQVVADTAGAFGLTIWSFTEANLAAAAPNRVMAQNLDVDLVSPNGIAISGLTTASAPILSANPSRRGICWHNPGTQLKWVSPGNLAAVQGAGSIAILPKDQKEIRARGRVRVNCAFNALTASNADPTLTALEYI